ncbi:hypothetical protein DFR70_10478 [Nocardia tenerifensis]|uniref:Uncharacterized protein n=1 Tax=Nocardia tenerifensis TaxID=228006 RepID=A0A318KQ24_9NOCA|nr:hypothetical protein [Nocardia tenerifensis]PXX65017.1 hypothetical protein DFR70_10478 [Nocardia tenerifensis]
MRGALIALPEHYSRYTVHTTAVPPDIVLSRQTKPRAIAGSAPTEPVELPVDPSMPASPAADAGMGAANAEAPPDNTMTTAANIAAPTCLVERFMKTNSLL